MLASALTHKLHFETELSPFLVCVTPSQVFNITQLAINKCLKTSQGVSHRKSVKIKKNTFRSNDQIRFTGFCAQPWLSNEETKNTQRHPHTKETMNHKIFLYQLHKISNVKVETFHKYQNQPETVCDVCTLPNSTELLL